MEGKMWDKRTLLHRCLSQAGVMLFNKRTPSSLNTNKCIGSCLNKWWQQKLLELPANSSINSISLKMPKQPWPGTLRRRVVLCSPPPSMAS